MFSIVSLTLASAQSAKCLQLISPGFNIEQPEWSQGNTKGNGFWRGLRGVQEKKRK